MLNTLLDHSVPEISVDEASKNEVVFLDARQLEEYEVSRIRDATFVGFDDFNLNKVADIPKDAEIIVYCSVGYRSEKIAEKLIEEGYQNVQNLYGGIFEWVNQGNEVVDKQGTPTPKVHAYNRIWGIWLKEGEKVY